MNLLNPSTPSGPAQIGDLTVEVDRDLCIGASACLPVAPNTWALDDEGKAVILDTADQDSEDAIIDSARVCPVLAIKVSKNGEQIFPEA